MKIYEKPMAIINKFEVADVITASPATDAVAKDLVADSVQSQFDGGATQGVVFSW